MRGHPIIYDKQKSWNIKRLIQPRIASPSLRKVHVMRTLAALVFPGFQTLDYFSPIEMLGDYGDEIEIITVAKGSDPVSSVHGQKIVIDKQLSEKYDYDLLFIPGGDSALNESEDEELMHWI